MKKLLFSSVLLCVAFIAEAQFIFDYLKAANSYYQKGDYASAAEYYEKFLDGDKNPPKKEFNPYSPQNASSKSAKTQCLSCKPS